MTNVKKRGFFFFGKAKASKMKKEEERMLSSINAGAFVTQKDLFYGAQEVVDALNLYSPTFKVSDVEVYNLYDHEGGQKKLQETVFVVNRKYGFFIAKIGTNKIRFQKEVPETREEAAMFRHYLGENYFAICEYTRGVVVACATVVDEGKKGLKTSKISPTPLRDMIHLKES